MNFEQAREYSFLVRWKTMECFSGPQCWCRIIVPVEPIPYNDEVEHFGKTLVSTETEYYQVVPDGSLDKKTAEYFVKLHNEYYERVKQSCKDALKETTDSLINLDENQVENLKQEWNKLNVGLQTFLRKEID